MAFTWKPGVRRDTMTFVFTTWTFWITLILIAGVLAAILGACAYQILLERKISAWAQDRLGPNRVGPWGLIQPIADGLKFLLKEQVIPGHVDKLFYLLAPMIAITTSLLAFAVVPFGQTTPAPQLLDYRGQVEPAAWRQPTSAPITEAPTYEPRPVWPQTVTEEKEVLKADAVYAERTGGKSFKQRLDEYNNSIQFVIVPHVDIGAVFVFAIGSLAVYAIVLSGWSSNNKYSFMGALRSSAQIISYEIPMGMSVLGIFVVTGSLNLERIIHHQDYHGWNILFQPLAALLFTVAVFAECNRLPFDLPEAEQELVGGYHTEYSGMKFALFFLGEYAHMITTSALVVIMFFGGWLLPGVTAPGDGGPLAMTLKVLVFSGKVFLFICFYMLVRWTLPRFRFDQLMGLAWKSLIPLALLSLVAVVLVQHFQPLGPYSPWLLLPASVLIFVGVAWLALRMPRPPAKARLTVYGHHTGQALPSDVTNAPG
jgi:NADH-quinone oxidoreductase subunit H